MKMKNVLKKVTALALSAIMALGMNVGVYAGTAVGTLPSGDGETLGNATELTRDNLGPTEVNIITKDYTNKLGNAVSYNQGVTYVAGYTQFSNNTDIDYIKGLMMDVMFSRPIANPETVEDPDSDEWFEFVSGGSALDIFGNDEEESKNNITLDFSYYSDDKMAYDYAILDFLYDITNNDLNEEYNTTHKSMTFIIALHNLKDDINISYSVPNGQNGYMPKGAGNSVETVRFADNAIKISPSVVRLKRSTISFDTTAGAPEGEGYAFDSVADIDGLKDGDTVPSSEIPAAPAMKTGVNDLNFAGWYTNATGALSDSNKLTTGAIIADDTTYYARWTAKNITLRWNTDSLKKFYPYGGENASLSALQSGMPCGGQLNFTLTIDGKEYNTADALSAIDQAVVNRVSFKFDYAEISKKLQGKTNSSGNSYRVVDIQPGGMAIARYSGVVKVTATYLGKYYSSNQSLVIVPGDVDGSGTIAMGDLSITAQIIRGTADAGAPGSRTEYLRELADADGNGAVGMGELTRMAILVRKGNAGNIYNPAFIIN